MNISGRLKKTKDSVTFSTGARYMLAAAFCYSIMGVCVKSAGSGNLPSQQIVFIRSLIVFIMTFTIVLKYKIPILGRNKSLLIVRALFGFIGLSAFFYTLTALPLGDAVILLYINPLLTAFIAPFILKEYNSKKQWGLYLIGFAGLFFIIKPSFSLNPYAAMIGLGGAFFTSLAYITVRKLGKTDHEFTIILYFTAFASFASLPGLSYRFVMPTPLEWLALAGAGILTQAAQFFMTRGLHREKAAKATNISYMNVLFSVIWGILIWGDLPDILTIIGTLFIAVSVFLANRNRNS